jgi:biopolymer transport protein ExbD
MRFRAEAKSANNLIDITPIVDTVFNLLIFFALSLNFISTPGIRVALPESKAQEIARERRDLQVSIAARGQLFVEDQPVEIRALGERMQRLAEANREAQVLIHADRRVSHGRVVEVMDLARSAGLYRLAIVTHPKAKER